MNDESLAPFSYAGDPVVAGRTLIEASAGTGKTFALAGLVLRLVLDGEWLATRPGGPPDLRRLLVVTFTRAATEELRTRIRASLRAGLRYVRDEPYDPRLAPLLLPLDPFLGAEGAQDRLTAALDGVDEAGIFTIHGFCKRVLDEAALESGTPFDAEFAEEGDGGDLRRRAAADAWARLTHTEPLLAALAVARKWTHSGLAEHFKNTAELPSVAVLPETPPLAECLAALRKHTESLRKNWDPGGLAALLDGLEWNKDVVLGDGAARAAALARIPALSDDPQAIDSALLFVRDDLKAALNKTRSEYKARWPSIEAHPGVQACTALAEALTTLGHALTRTFLSETAERIETIKRRRGLLTANDFIRRLHDALHANDTRVLLRDGIRQRFGVALVDEFQDTDPLQYAIFRTAFEGRPLYFVGDPKQAIYAFRGADLHAYLRAQREADRRATLGTNWRSTARLVGAVNRVFEGPARPFLFEGIPFRPAAPARDGEAPALSGDGRPPLVFWRFGAPPDERINKTDATPVLARAVAAEAQRLLAGGMALGGRPLAAGDLAVLVPDRFAADDVLKALRKAGLPAVFTGSSDIRDSTEIADVEFLLRAVLLPGDERALRAALATELWGWDAAAVAALDEDGPRLDALRQRLRQWQRAWRRHGVLHALAQFHEDEGTAERMLARRDGERRMTNLRHVAELLHEAEAAAGRSPENLLHWLRHRHDHTLPSRDRVELRLERDDEAVQITTHHSAKGLEYEVVFLPFLWVTGKRDHERGEATLARVAAGALYDLGSPERERHERLRQADELAERLRIAYVALTRARQRCYVGWGHLWMAHHSALGYLLAGHDTPWPEGADRDPDALAEHVAEARKRAKEAHPYGRLETLAAEHPDLLAVEDLPDGLAPLPPPSEPEASEPDLRPKPLSSCAEGRVRSPWRPVSFTAWAGSRRAPAAEPAAADEPEPEPRRADRAETGIHAFAAGAAAGTCLHEILQRADLSEPDAEGFDDRNREIVQRALGKYGLAAPRPGGRRRHRAPLDPEGEVLALLRRVASAPLLGEPGAPLSACDRGTLAAEWAFTFPVGRVAPARLAEAFRQHGAPPFDGAYGEALARLDAEEVDGFLSGSADLVACHGDRWWVLDWKSNHLGPDAAAYTPEALARAMTEHHYGLQLHLYTLALHRYLRTRLGTAYRYEEQVGAAVYVFLRGLGEGEAGVFRHRPSEALIDALDTLLSGPAPLADALRQ